MSIRLLQGDCREVLATLDAGSIDACVTDPPYHLGSMVKRLSRTNAADVAKNFSKTVEGQARSPYAALAVGFMGKTWDGGDVAMRPETWADVARVLKPGAHLAAFGGTRTFHRVACAIEDAGFEIRDTLCWLYGSGFPKSHNQPGGWGTALKPAWEPIILARKPLVGTVAGNMAAHGTGALNIEKCRVSPSSQPLDEDVCGLLFALGSPRDNGADFPERPPYFAQRICAALGACSNGRTAHEHNAAGRDGHTTEEDVRAVQSLLSRLRSSVELYAGSWSEALSSLLGCQTCRRFGDEHSRLIKEAARDGLPSLAGALADTCRWLYARTYNRGCPCSGHPSSSGVEDLRESLLFDLISLAKQQDATYLTPRKDITRNHSRGSSSASSKGIYGDSRAQETHQTEGQSLGRWPANVAHDGSDEVLEAFAKFGQTGASAPVRGTEASRPAKNTYGEYGRVAGVFHADTGTAARFFYEAKASREERGEGNNHPTVKPLALMRWLCRLITPPGGTVLDPFLGSGSTAIAADQEGFHCIGIEQSAEYLEIARRRLATEAPLFTEVA